MKKSKRALIIAAAAMLTVTSVLPAASYAVDEEPAAGSYPGGLDDDGKGYESEWVKDEKGRFFYYNEDGEYVTGEQIINGVPYLFAKNGVLKTGWRTVNGKRYYYDPETGKPVYGILSYGGSDFYVGEQSGKCSDSIVLGRSGELLLTDDKGAVITDEGFVEYDDSFYYITNGGALADGEIEIDGCPYLFDEDGREYTGWVTAGGVKRYYFPATGKAAEGLFKDGDSWYYGDIKEGVKKGVVQVDGVDYFFAEDTGKLHTGWIGFDDDVKYFYKDATYAKGMTEIGDSTYIFAENGSLIKGFIDYDDKLYMSDENGKLLTGMQQYGDDTYCFGSDFAAAEGLIDHEGARYLFGSDKKMVRGFGEYDGKRYYFDQETGKMRMGKLSINGKKYYFSDDGSMQFGWFTFGEDKVYFGADGTAAVGITEIDGDRYYFNPETGAMGIGRLVIENNKYYFADDGKMQYGIIAFNDGKYYFADDGKMTTGWVEVDEKKYYFDPTSGKMVTGRIMDDWNLDENGAVPLSDVQKRAKSIIGSVGTSTQAIYNYVCGHNKYKLMESTRSLAQIEQKGWDYFANYALDNRFIVCYYFAAVTDLLFKQAGYTTRIVYGTGRGTGDHYWNQVLINGNWTNFDTCNGYYNVSFSYLQGQNYTLYKYVDAKYYR